MKRDYQNYQESEASTLDATVSSSSQATESISQGCHSSPLALHPSPTPSPCASNKSAFKPYKSSHSIPSSLAPPSPTPSAAKPGRDSTLCRLARLLLDIPHASGHLAAHMMELQTQRLAPPSSPLPSPNQPSPSPSSCDTPIGNLSASPDLPFSGLTLRRLARLLLDIPPLAGELSSTIAAILMERQAAASHPVTAPYTSSRATPPPPKRAKVAQEQQQLAPAASRPATPLPHPTLQPCLTSCGSDASAVPQLPISSQLQAPSLPYPPAKLVPVRGSRADLAAVLRRWAMRCKAETTKASAPFTQAAPAPIPTSLPRFTTPAIPAASHTSHQAASREGACQQKRRRQEQVTKLLWLRLQQQQCQWQAAQLRAVAV